MKYWSVVCTAFVTSLIGLFLTLILAPPLRNLPASVLINQSHNEDEAELILLFMGDALDRAPYAARRLKEGKARQILFAESEKDELVMAGIKNPEGMMVYRYLTEKLGVQKEQIVFLSDTKASSTFEEAEILLRTAHEMKAKRLRLVTSWYHSSRTSWIVEKTMKRHGEEYKNFILISDPSPMPEQWYKKELHFLSVFNEYLKWPYYLVKY